ncbi:MAG: hypothetical protein HOO85_10875 [Methylotenera sp.]|nr:hypothetical protein [Methylotenera sp.]
MKKLSILLILACTSSHALAEWTMIQTNDNGNMYIDFDTLQKTGDLVSISTLNDYYSLQQKGELSSQWTELHDCKYKKFKALAINDYTGNMGNGNLIQATHFNEAETAWSDVVRYSIGELKANVICSR